MVWDESTFLGLVMYYRRTASCKQRFTDGYVMFLSAAVHAAREDVLPLYGIVVMATKLKETGFSH